MVKWEFSNVEKVIFALLYLQPLVNAVWGSYKNVQLHPQRCLHTTC